MTWDAAKHRAARERANVATKGPWDYERGGCFIWSIQKSEQLPGRSDPWICGDDAPYREEDAAFIAHARTDLPEALDAIEERDRLLRECVPAVEALIGWIDCKGDQWSDSGEASALLTKLSAVLEGREQG